MQLPEDIWNNENLVRVLTEGRVAIMPTDTIYGMVGRAEDESVVDRIYTARKRNPEKPFIILIGELSQLEKFSVNLSEEQDRIIKEYWPGPVSIILECSDKKLSYLHRDTNTLAFRMPAPKSLQELLNKVGPLIAPSANLEGMAPATNIEDAKKYFGDSVDLYVDGGTLIGKASKLIKLHKDGSVSIIRQ